MQSMKTLYASGFTRFNDDKKKSLLVSNSYVSKDDLLVDTNTMQYFYSNLPKTLQTRVGKFIYNLTEYDIVSRGIELVGLTFINSIDNSDKTNKIKNSWKKFWYARKKNKDYDDYTFLN